MKTVRISQGFHAYPNDKRRDFAEGEVVELSNEFADLIVGKGLAAESRALAVEGEKIAPKGGAKPDPETAV